MTNASKKIEYFLPKHQLLMRFRAYALPILEYVDQWFLTFFLPRLPQAIFLCFKPPLTLNML